MKGANLSHEGIAFIKKMFEAGASKAQVARRMDISNSSAGDWYQKWLNWAHEAG